MAISIGKERAIRLAKTNWWEGKSAKEIAVFQLFTEELCMPFDLFHKAIEEALGRPVYTHEFGSSGHLEAELLGEKPAPTTEDIIGMLPADKVVVVGF